mmetsp:Transcript_6618/g.15152  ORF Transcript_6618/g.15152 Transcript_6618/m.15152 type:complete len:188 (-) Transcript_6618:244-807(-)
MQNDSSDHRFSFDPGHQAGNDHAHSLAKTDQNSSASIYVCRHGEQCSHDCVDCKRVCRYHSRYTACVFMRDFAMVIPNGQNRIAVCAGPSPGESLFEFNLQLHMRRYVMWTPRALQVTYSSLSQFELHQKDYPQRKNIIFVPIGSQKFLQAWNPVHQFQKQACRCSGKAAGRMIDVKISISLWRLQH